MIFKYLLGAALMIFFVYSGIQSFKRAEEKIAASFEKIGTTFFVIAAGILIAGIYSLF